MSLPWVWREPLDHVGALFKGEAGVAPLNIFMDLCSEDDFLDTWRGVCKDSKGTVRDWGSVLEALSKSRGSGQTIIKHHLVIPGHARGSDPSPARARGSDPYPAPGPGRGSHPSGGNLMVGQQQESCLRVAHVLSSAFCLCATCV
jgi:hypothetical protein